MTYPPIAPARMNVIAHEHADFRLATVTAQSLGTFSSNCLNTFLLEPGFNPVNRIAPSLQDQMVRQGNRNLLQRLRVDVSGASRLLFGAYDKPTNPLPYWNAGGGRIEACDANPDLNARLSRALASRYLIGFPTPSSARVRIK